MSGVLNVLLSGGGGKILLPTTNITLTSGSVAIPNPATVTDQKWYGFAPAYGGYGPIGSISPSTVGIYTVTYLLEQAIFSSTGGAYTGLSSRLVTLVIAAGGLTKDAFTTLVTPTGGSLATSAASFSDTGSAGEWQWIVTTGSDDGTADYLGSGTVTVTQ